jgi:hypothetical protein
MIILYKGKGRYKTILDRPRVSQKLEAPRFHYNRHTNMVRLSALRPGNVPGTNFWVDPRIIQRKIPMTPSGIESATFRLVAQCLNQLRHWVVGYFVLFTCNTELPFWISSVLQFEGWEDTNTRYWVGVSGQGYCVWYVNWQLAYDKCNCPSETIRTHRLVCSVCTRSSNCRG